MDKIINDLTRMKRSIEDANKKLSEYTGKLEHLEETLVEEFSCQSVEEAEVLLDELVNEVEDIEKKIKKGYEEIKENYDL